MLGGSDVIAAEMEEVIDMIVRRKEPLRLARSLQRRVCRELELKDPVVFFVEPRTYSGATHLWSVSRDMTSRPTADCPPPRDKRRGNPRRPEIQVRRLTV